MSNKNVFYLPLKNIDDPDVVDFLKRTPLSGLIVFGHSQYTDPTVFRARQVLERIKTKIGNTNLWETCVSHLHEHKNIGATIHNCIIMNVNLYIDRFLKIRALNKVEVQPEIKKEPVMENEQNNTNEIKKLEDQEYVTAKQAHELGIKPHSTIQKYASVGSIPFKLGWNGIRLFKKTDLIDFFNPKNPRESYVKIKKEINELQNNDLENLVNRIVDARLPKDDPWQPADTAPTNGTPFLAINDVYNDVCVIRIWKDTIFLNMPLDEKMHISLKWNFNRWMPLPEIKECM